VHGTFGADRGRCPDLHEVAGLFRQRSSVGGSLAQCIDGGHEARIPLDDRLVILWRGLFAGHSHPLSNQRTWVPQYIAVSPHPFVSEHAKLAFDPRPQGRTLVAARQMTALHRMSLTALP
jgi:hypothetical protein